MSTSDLQPFRDLALRFARKELDPKAIDSDNYPFCDFNRGAIRTAQEAGLFKIMLSEAHGGAGQGIAALCEILFSLAKSDASFAAIVFINTLSKSAVLKWGSKPIIERFIQSQLIAFPAYDLPTDLPTDLIAEKMGDAFSLNGRVEFFPLAPVADALILPAKIQDSEVNVFFLIDARTKGISIGEPILSLGLRSCPVSDVELDRVETSAESLLCKDARTEYPALTANFRPAVAALAVGVLSGSYEAAKAYAKERFQGGKIIVEHEQVGLMLANMAVLTESGKALVQSMAQAADEGKPWPLSDAGLILLTEQASRATTDGVQVLGGYGYMKDYGQEKRMRDAKQIESIFGASPLKRMELIAEILRQEK